MSDQQDLRLYLLYAASPDQYGRDRYGTSEVVGAYSTAEKAEAAEKTLKRHLTEVKTLVLDAPPVAGGAW